MKNKPSNACFLYYLCTTFDSTLTHRDMKKVTKQEFFDFFKNRTDISTLAESAKVWIVVKRSSSVIIAKSIEDKEGNEDFFISE